MRGLWRSGQPRLPWRRLVFAVLGVALVVALLGLLGGAVDLTLLFLGFAPSCLLVYLLPEAPCRSRARWWAGTLSRPWSAWAPRRSFR